MPLTNQGSLWTFNNLVSYRNIMQFQISSRRENRQRDNWVIKIRVLRKAFSRQFHFIRCRRKYLLVAEKRGYSRFTFVEKTISNSPKVTRTKFLGSNGLFCFINISKSGSFKNPFTLESEDLSFWYKRKLAAAKAVANYGHEWGLTWYFLWRIYTSIPTWTH